MKEGKRFFWLLAGFHGIVVIVLGVLYSMLSSESLSFNDFDTLVNMIKFIAYGSIFLAFGWSLLAVMLILSAIQRKESIVQEVPVALTGILLLTQLGTLFSMTDLIDGILEGIFNGSGIKITIAMICISFLVAFVRPLLLRNQVSVSSTVSVGESRARNEMEFSSKPETEEEGGLLEKPTVKDEPAPEKKEVAYDFTPYAEKGKSILSWFAQRQQKIFILGSCIFLVLVLSIFVYWFFQNKSMYFNGGFTVFFTGFIGFVIKLLGVVYGVMAILTGLAIKNRVMNKNSTTTIQIVVYGILAVVLIFLYYYLFWLAIAFVGCAFSLFKYMNNQEDGLTINKKMIKSIALASVVGLVLIGGYSAFEMFFNKTDVNLGDYVEYQFTGVDGMSPIDGEATIVPSINVEKGKTEAVRNFLSTVDVALWEDENGTLKSDTKYRLKFTYPEETAKQYNLTISSDDELFIKTPTFAKRVYDLKSLNKADQEKIEKEIQEALKMEIDATDTSEFMPSTGENFTMSEPTLMESKGSKESKAFFSLYAYTISYTNVESSYSFFGPSEKKTEAVTKRIFYYAKIDNLIIDKKGNLEKDYYIGIDTFESGLSDEDKMKDEKVKASFLLDVKDNRLDIYKY